MTTVTMPGCTIDIDLGDFVTEIHYSTPISGIRLFASAAGKVRYIGTDGQLHQPALMMTPSVDRVAKLVSNGRTQRWGTRKSSHRLSAC